MHNKNVNKSIHLWHVAERCRETLLFMFPLGFNTSAVTLIGPYLAFCAWPGWKFFPHNGKWLQLESITQVESYHIRLRAASGPKYQASKKRQSCVIISADVAAWFSVRPMKQPKVPLRPFMMLSPMSQEKDNVLRNLDQINCATVDVLRFPIKSVDPWNCQTRVPQGSVGIYRY